jgi:phosphatidylglycerophosphatase C
MMTKKGIAFFDFDGTLSTKDSFIAFIRFTHGPYKLFIGLLIHLPLIIAYYIKCYPNHKLKEHFFSYFYKGQSVAALETSGRAFNKQQLPQLIYTDALRLITWHQAQGHALYLITASSNIWLDAWCKNHGMIWIGTDFESKHGLYTGKIAGKNCHGQVKAQRVQALLHEYPNAESYGYGNEGVDEYYLKLVDHSFRGALDKKNVDRILSLLTKDRA